MPKKQNKKHKVLYFLGENKVPLFLAAMSSSRSDIVTQFVRPLVMKEFFFSLRSYKGVSRKSNGCFNEV